MQLELNQMTLANLGGGAAVERFQEELQKVITNILDPNTEAQAKRSVVLKVTIKPEKIACEDNPDQLTIDDFVDKAEQVDNVEPLAAAGAGEED